MVTLMTILSEIAIWVVGSPMQTLDHIMDLSEKVVQKRAKQLSIKLYSRITKGFSYHLHYNLMPSVRHITIFWRKELPLEDLIVAHYSHLPN